MAKTATYALIESQVLGSSQASVTFSSIPATYTDLVLVCVNGNTLNSDNDIYIRFNSDTASNYSRTQLIGNGSTATSSRTSNNTEIRIGPSFNNLVTSTLIMHIFDYANTTTNKTVLLRSGNAAGYLVAETALWRKTPEAINTIALTLQGGSYVFGSTFRLYGIQAGNA